MKSVKSYSSVLVKGEKKNLLYIFNLYQPRILLFHKQFVCDPGGQV